MRASRNRTPTLPHTTAELTAWNLGNLLRLLGVTHGTPAPAQMELVSEHWTPSDMDAMDTLGTQVFFEWVERGLLSHDRARRDASQ